ncbi:phenylalanine--tRNA ligase subunit beta [Oscillospiraceae bacterium OttesenSCG-928-G22]|nr:phenylalanine--tRNA ligase subunit beta [Oscillospiraceae bacterium OttesenSCG-928-G22]
MNLSRNWLSEFVNVGDISSRDFAEAMTMSGSKVEGFAPVVPELSNIVIGKILSIEPHPNADKLIVCKLDVGKGAPLTIATGAKNVKEGDIVPVALDGATLPGGKNIVTSDLRGVRSEGMMCSFTELGLTHANVPYADPDGGILVLTEGDPQIGTDAIAFLGLNDEVVEFEITPNRPDCLSVIGLSREVAATFQRPMTPRIPKATGTGDDVSSALSVRIDAPALCPRYTARVVKNVKIGPSPAWMRARLFAAGLRPINNIVDITNYVMLEYGQPMHAFDHACLGGGKIVVREARDGETITTLDGKPRSLTPGMLLICDEEVPTAVAGVMGGLESEITGSTNMVVFESATFNGPSVRRTATALGMRTDASSRFEKGLDIENTIPAVDRACELVELLGCGEVLSGMVDVNPAPFSPRTLPLEPEKINTLLGDTIDTAFMERALISLGFAVNDGTVEVPSWRADVERMADLAEEIARLYGYNKLPSTLAGGSTTMGGLSPRQQYERKCAELCRSFGYSQIITYSFIGKGDFDRVLVPETSPLRSCVTIQNPLGEERSLMRTTMIPSMAEALSRNYRNRNEAAHLYELGRVYYPSGDKLPDERLVLSLGAYGGAADFFSFKGTVEAILNGLRVTGVRTEPLTDHPSFHPGRAARVTKDGESIGVFGELHPLLLAAHDIDARAYLAELDFEAIDAKKDPESRFTPLPRFPAITRDIAVVVDRAIPVGQILDCIREEAGELLRSAELFDVYTGSQIDGAKKSVAFSLLFRADDRTLTDWDADAAFNRVVTALTEKFSAKLR